MVTCGVSHVEQWHKYISPIATVLSACSLSLAAIYLFTSVSINEGHSPLIDDVDPIYQSDLQKANYLEYSISPAPYYLNNTTTDEQPSLES